MALTGGATFVANGKKFLQQPACLGSLNNGQLARSVYRVGIQVGEVSSHHASVTMTVQLRGYTNSSCCAPLSNTIGLVVDLDVHQELMETLPVSKSTSVLAADWHHFHSENYLFCLGGNKKRCKGYLKDFRFVARNPNPPPSRSRSHSSSSRPAVLKQGLFFRS